MIPEIVAPAGDWTNLRTAVQSGADAVYFGITGFNMRANAKNFDMSDIEKINKFCHESGVKTHLALNTIIYDNELKKLEKILNSAKRSGTDMIICWDMSVMRKALDLGLDVCLSTQASVSNSESARYYKNLGVKRIVPARECSLDQIKKIKETGIEVEIFVHGAMCVSVSGRCFMSHHLYEKSANRGECMQPCRYEYTIKNKETGAEMDIENNYIMSAKDLCTINVIDKILDSGVDALKIEGRKRSFDYVHTSVSCYKEARDLFLKNELTEQKKLQLTERLKTVFNREFSTGFYLGVPVGEFAKKGNSSSVAKKIFIGKVIQFNRKDGKALVKLTSGELVTGDNIAICGEDTGSVFSRIGEMEKKGKPVKIAYKTENICLKLDRPVNKDDNVFVIKNA